MGKNLKPENLVEIDCMNWFRNNGFDMSIIDSKAKFSPRAGMYLKRLRGTNETIVDCVGNYGSLACYVEFKACGRFNTASYEQLEFLRRKIRSGCFACVTDSVERLVEYFNKFNELRSSRGSAIDYLLGELPKGKKPKI